MNKPEIARIAVVNSADALRMKAALENRNLEKMLTLHGRILHSLTLQVMNSIATTIAITIIFTLTLQMYCT